jgi:hypothetical protein
LVSFHIHTNGSDGEDGGRRVVNPIVINMVWIGLGVMFWTIALFLTAEAVRTIMKLTE